MLNLVLTTDTLDLITDAAVTVDVHVSGVDATGTPLAPTPWKQNTAFTTAATTTIASAPAASTFRNIKTVNVRNKHLTTPVVVTVRFNANGTAFELIKVTLLAGETLEYVEGIGWFVVQSTQKVFFRRRVTTDSVHATAATFADVTGLTCPVQAGKHYNFLAHLYHISNATTTGAQFGINGPAMAALLIATIDVTLNHATAPTFSAGSVAALNTAASVETTGAATIALGILSGWINPSADGTFAIRATSEVTVGNGLIVKAGSWLQLWEADN